MPVLTVLIFAPLVGALVTLFLPAGAHRAIRGWATAVTLVPVLLAAWMAAGFQPGRAEFQFVEQVPWVPSLGIDYFVGVDGISFSMLALTAVVFCLAAVASYGIQARVKEYFALFLLLETAVLGVFSALDFILFYLFWELVLIPMYFLIGIWGGERKEYAALKFLLYTMVGSLLMLVGILALWYQTGQTTFAIPEIAAKAPTQVPEAWKGWIFLFLFLGFAVKVPVFPFHTWLPDAHVEAPTPISVILAALLLKMGTYGFLRISHPVLPDVARGFALTLAVLGVVNVVYGALAALAQKDFKRVVAYSSVSHMGFVLLGIAANTTASVAAGVFEMVSHGIIAAMLFLLVGVFYDRTHTRDLGRLGGFFLTTPVAGAILVFAFMGNLGLPGMSGFISEFFTLLGSVGVYPTLVYVAAGGLVLVAAFSLLTVQKVLMGEAREEYAGLPDVSPREMVTLVPLMAATLALGIAPALLFSLLNAPVNKFVSLLGGA